MSIKNLDKNKTTFEKVIQANKINFYYIKLCKTIRTSFSIKDINIYHLLNLFINNKDCIC